MGMAGSGEEIEETNQVAEDSTQARNQLDPMKGNIETWGGLSFKLLAEKEKKNEIASEEQRLVKTIPIQSASNISNTEVEMWRRNEYFLETAGGVTPLDENLNENEKKIVEEAELAQRGRLKRDLSLVDKIPPVSTHLKISEEMKDVENICKHIF